VAGDEMREWIEHSYDLVVAKLPRQRRDALRAP
jgi:predicted DNA-binding protein (MmcQ/YjbR family)